MAGEKVKKRLPTLDYRVFVPKIMNKQGIHSVYLGDAWVIGFTGTRGSGKSLSMALTIGHALLQGLTVWSNMKVEFYCRMKGGKIKYFSTRPLDMEALYSLSGDMRNGVVAVDELQYYCDSRSSMSIRNRLMNAILYQVRKRSLDFYFTIKTIGWLDLRIREMELDIEVSCMDMAVFSDSIKRGTEISWYLYDRSGVWTGFPWQPWMREPTSKMRLHNAHSLWRIYDTSEIVDYFEAMTPVRLDLQEMKITNRQEKSQEDLQSIVELSSWYKSQGYNNVPVQDFVNMANEYMGADRSADTIGKLVSKLGVKRKRTRSGSIYLLDDLKCVNLGLDKR